MDKSILRHCDNRDYYDSTSTTENSHNLDTSGSASLAHVEEAARDYELY